MIGNLKKQYRYEGVLKRNIVDALGEMSALNIIQRQKALELVNQFLT